MRPKCIVTLIPGGIPPQLYMGVKRPTPRAIRDVHKAVRTRRLETEVRAPPTLRRRECFSIAIGQGQQRCSSLSSGGHTYEAVAPRKGTGILDSMPA